MKDKVDQHEHVCDKDEEERQVEKALVGLCAARGVLLALDEGGEGLVGTRGQGGLRVVLFDIITLGQLPEVGTCEER